MSRIPSYLITNRFGVYHFNMTVPHDLKQIVGKGRLRKSLNTKDLNRAIPIIRILTVRVNQWFNLLRRSHNMHQTDPIEDIEAELLQDLLKLQKNEEILIKNLKIAHLKDVRRFIRSWLSLACLIMWTIYAKTDRSGFSQNCLMHATVMAEKFPTGSTRSI